MRGSRVKQHGMSERARPKPWLQVEPQGWREGVAVLQRTGIGLPVPTCQLTTIYTSTNGAPP